MKIIKKAALLLAFCVLIPSNVFAQNDGELRVSFSSLDPPEHLELAELLRTAEALLRDTFISVTGADIKPTKHWVTQPVHNQFKEQINATRTALNNFDANRQARIAKLGEPFDMTISIANNTGIAGIILSIGIPPELELTGFTAHSEWRETHQNYENFPITNNFRIGVAQSENITANGDMFTFTFTPKQATETGQTTAPITISFANAQNYEHPTDASGRELQISLPGTKSNCGNPIWEIGGVIILE